MRGDFSRNPNPPVLPSSPPALAPVAIPSGTYIGPLVEQGRPLLDAYWNQHVVQFEQRFQWMFDRFVNWPGEASDDFKIDRTDHNVLFKVSGAHSIGSWTANFGKDLALPKFASPNPSFTNFLIYAEAWLQSVYPNEQDTDLIEPALAGNDGAVWLAPCFAVAAFGQVNGFEFPTSLDHVETLFANAPRLKAEINLSTSAATNPCGPDVQPMLSQLENQLYRVEIHDAGKPPLDDSKKGRPLSIKWSRNNASVRFALLPGSQPAAGQQTLSVKLGNLTADPDVGLSPGDYVELIFSPDSAAGPDLPADWYEAPLPLLHVESVDLDTGVVEIFLPADNPLRSTSSGKLAHLTHIIRWDQKDS